MKRLISLQLILSACLIIIYSCISSTGNNNKQNDYIRHKKHIDLICFRSEFLRDLTTIEFNNSDSTLKEEKIHIVHIKDTSYIYVNLPVSGCPNFDGDIKKTGDSLTLEYWLKNDSFCTEINFYKLTYKLIDKSGNNRKVRLKYLEYKNGQRITSYNFYWGGIADFKVLASNLALNGSKRRVLRNFRQNLYVTFGPSLKNETEHQL